VSGLKASSALMLPLYTNALRSAMLRCSLLRSAGLRLRALIWACSVPRKHSSSVGCQLTQPVGVLVQQEARGRREAEDTFCPSQFLLPARKAVVPSQQGHFAGHLYCSAISYSRITTAPAHEQVSQ
jgi:hypothetical protein